MSTPLRRPAIAYVPPPTAPLRTPVASTQSFGTSSTGHFDGASELSGLVSSSASAENIAQSASAQTQARAQQAQFDTLEQVKMAAPTVQLQSRTTMQITSRTAAEKQSAATLKAYDERISTLLASSTAASGVCPMGYRWYPSKYGYHCGGGHHLVSPSEAEALLRGLRPAGPYVEDINALYTIEMMPQPNGLPNFRRVPPTPRERSLTPPLYGWHEPMHWDPVKRAQHRMPRMPKMVNGEWYSRAEMDHGFAISCRDLRSQLSGQSRFERMGMRGYPGW